jgi:hypothetical protein
MEIIHENLSQFKLNLTEFVVWEAPFLLFLWEAPGQLPHLPHGKSGTVYNAVIDVVKLEFRTYIL